MAFHFRTNGQEKILSAADAVANLSFGENPFAELNTNPAFAGKVKRAVAGSTAGKIVATILGEIKLFAERIWLMSQSAKHKAFRIGDLDWQEKLNMLMPAVLLRQFRIYYEKEVPVGVILFARVDAATAARLDAGAPTLRPADWQSGKDKPDGAIRIVDIIAPFGGREEMGTEFAGAVG